MNVVGLIVEYNPLHNGHLYHFERSMAISKADASVIVMSGHFLQRGEPALVNKWARAQMALEMGADLVFELPYVYSTQHASWFAFGAVSLLNHLPFVTHLCFGSESGSIDQLQSVASVLLREPTQIKDLLHQYLKQGWSYPKAYSHAVMRFLGEHQTELTPVIREPNNILGLHYLIALSRLNSAIKPLTIKRYKADYHQAELSGSDIASATSIRHALFKEIQPRWNEVEKFVPPFTMEILQNEYQAGRGLISWENYYPYLAHLFLSQSESQLNRLYEMEEGVEHRFKKKIQMVHSVEHLISEVKTKRYTRNRIQRMLVHALTQCSKEAIEHLNLEQGPRYLRLLGYSTKGQALLNQYKKKLAVPLISNVQRDHPPMLHWDLQASRIYHLGMPSHIGIKEMRREISQPPLRRK